MNPVEETIPTYSHSQLGAWNRCHYSWFLNYDQKWQTLETKDYFVEGNIAHDLLMTYYKNITLTDHTACVRLVKQRVAEYHNAAGSDTIKLGMVTKIAKMIKLYVEDYVFDHDSKWDFLDAEKYIKALLQTPNGRQFYLEGYVDLLTREKATGRLFIWDHKTVGNKGKFWNEAQLLMDSQTPTYVAVLQFMGIPIYGALVNQLNKYEYKGPISDEELFRRSPIFHNESELKIRLLELGRTVDEIEDCKESRVFRRNINKECSMCFYQDPCLTKMKAPELPLDQIMSVDFIKKTPKKVLI